MLVWFVVTIITLFIIGLWFLNMKTLVFDVTNKKSSEGAIYRSMEQEVSQIFSSFSIQDSINTAPTTTSPPTSSKELEANIKKSLSEIAAAAVTGTATGTVASTTTVATTSAR